MPFHFKKTEAAGQAVRRVYRERIEAALVRLRKGDGPAEVHGVRKEIKKLRALFRLVRGEIRRAIYRKGAKALRKAAGSLTAPRDARVMLRVFKKLVGRDARRFAGIEQALQSNWRQATRRFRKQDSIAAAKKSLQKINRRRAGLKIKASGWAAIEPGLQESYRRGRQACAFARRQPTSEHFHEWRKQVKNFWHQLRLVCPAWLTAARGLTDRLEHLGQLLGEEHDLDLLKHFVTKHRGKDDVEAVALNRLIEASQAKHRAAALKLGTRLYAEAPAIICHRLGNYWNDWRGK